MTDVGDAHGADCRDVGGCGPECPWNAYLRDGIGLVPVARMTGIQQRAWQRDIPGGCCCDYLWTGLVWTRSGVNYACDVHNEGADDDG